MFVELAEQRSLSQTGQDLRTGSIPGMVIFFLRIDYGRYIPGLQLFRRRLCHLCEIAATGKYIVQSIGKHNSRSAWKGAPTSCDMTEIMLKLS